MATLTDNLRRTREVICTRGFGAHAGFLDEAIRALESGADTGDLLARLDAVTVERDRALHDADRLRERVEMLEGELEELRKELDVVDPTNAIDLP